MMAWAFAFKFELVGTFHREPVQQISFGYFWYHSITYVSLHTFSHVQTALSSVLWLNKEWSSELVLFKMWEWNLVKQLV